VSVTTFNGNDRNLFGYRAYIVNSDSMAATDFNAGDLIFVKEVDPSSLREGDIITFISQNSESFGETVTHKIRKLTRDASGNPGFITYGTTTNVDDATVVTFPYILGQYQTHLPYVGTFFNFLKTPQGYIVCIFVPFMLLILYQGVNCVQLFRRYKGEQLEEMEAEKARIEEERAQNARMMEELLALKAQLQQQAAKEGENADADS
jgi:signal peptidase